MGPFEATPARAPLAGVQTKLALQIAQHEIPGEFPILQSQVPDVVDEKEKFRWKLPNLLREVVVSARLERQPDDIDRPAHQLVQILVLFFLLARVDRLGNAQNRVTSLARDDSLYPPPGECPIESEGTRAAIEFGGVGHTENRFETEPESADRTGVSLARHVREHESLDTGAVDRTPVVGAVQEIFGKANQDALPLRRIDQRVGAVLNKFEQLPMRVSAAGGIVFEIGVLGDQCRLSAI